MSALALAQVERGYAFAGMTLPGEVRERMARWAVEHARDFARYRARFLPESVA